MELQSTISEFLLYLDKVYGLYVDSINGYGGVFEMADKMFKENPNQQILLIGKDDKLNETKQLHSVRLSEFRDRNSRGNFNEIMIGNLCLVLIYQLWEDQFRQRIADLKNMAKDDLKVDSFGDLNKIRRAIIHNNFKAGKETKNLKCFNFFVDRDKILVTNREFEQIINRLKTDLKGLV